MAECRHETEVDLCDYCSTSSTPRTRESSGKRSDGHSFALIYAPSMRKDTFLHLNRQGERWKIRWYFSPSRPAEDLAQSGEKTTKLDVDLDTLQLVHDLPYPTSRAPSGVKVTNSRYWFDEIASVNAAYGITSTGLQT